MSNCGAKFKTGCFEEAQVRTACMWVDENLVRMNIHGFVSEMLLMKMQLVVEVLANGIKFLMLVLVMNHMIITNK